jgi:8-oxo-dGTP pyrophosphatase MutT (NUDIX family)
MSFQPDLTVAAVIERDGQFLMIEERVGNRMVFNQPAGHLERNESLVDAVIRETLEETAWTFQPQALVGIYLWDQPEKQRSFLRFTFCGQVGSHDPHRPLDHGIKRAMWMDRPQVLARNARLRSPMVLKCIDDYLAGRRYPLDLIQHMQLETAASAFTERRFATSALPLIERLY